LRGHPSFWSQKLANGKEEMRQKGRKGKQRTSFTHSFGTRRGPSDALSSEMRRRARRFLVILVCVLSLLLPCAPQVVGDDEQVSDGAATDVDRAEEAEVGGGREGGAAAEEPRVALEETSEDSTTEGAGDPADESDGVEEDGVPPPDGDGDMTTTTAATAATTAETGGDGDGEKLAVQANPQDDIIICAFFMGNPQGAHLEQLSQMFHSARFVHGPNSRLMIVTDEESKFAPVDRIHEDLEILRFTIDEATFKYNIGSGKSKNHLSLMPKRVAFESFLLEKLHKEGNKTNVVFVDTDLLFLRSVADVFSSNDFDVAMTFRKPIPGRAHTAFLARQEPVNLGIKFANGNGLAVAFAFWQKALEIWNKASYAKCNDCDQQAFSDAGKLASTDKRLRNKHPFVNEVSTDAGTARVRYVHCSYFNSYPSKGNCGPSTASHVLHFKGDLKRWMPKVYGMMKKEVLAPVAADAKVSATHSVAQHTVHAAATTYAHHYKSSHDKKKKRG
jgi:hypothetical protein